MYTEQQKNTKLIESYFESVCPHSQLTNGECFSLDFITPSGIVAETFDAFNHINIVSDVVWFSVIQRFQLLWLQHQTIKKNHILRKEFCYLIGNDTSNVWSLKTHLLIFIYLQKFNSQVTIDLFKSVLFTKKIH